LGDLLTIFLNNLLPVFLIAGAGYLLSRFKKIDPRSLSDVIFYIFSPCLIFTLIIQSNLSDDAILRMTLFATTTILAVGGLTLISGKLLRFERDILASVTLASMFMNSGNFGLSVTLFAFGEAALSYASLFFVVSAGLTYSVGAFIASLGTLNPVQALGNLLKVPTLYALILAIVVLRLGWVVPLPIARTAKLLGDASIPSMLLLIGLQFKTMRWQGNFLPLLVASGMRLVASPLIAWLASPLFGLPIAAHQAGVLEAAMPTAVTTTVLATQFNSQPSFVTSVVVLTTLLSPLTLTPLLALLGA
jgi:predicted permease